MIDTDDEREYNKSRIEPTDGLYMTCTYCVVVVMTYDTRCRNLSHVYWTESDRLILNQCKFHAALNSITFGRNNATITCLKYLYVTVICYYRSNKEQYLDDRLRTGRLEFPMTTRTNAVQYRRHMFSRTFYCTALTRQVFLCKWKVNEATL